MKEKIKLVKNLLEKRSARRKEKLFVVEGPHLVQEAGDRIKFVIHSENTPLSQELNKNGVACFKVSKEQFAELSEVETPQGILAVVNELDYEFRDLLKGEQTLIVYCLGVQDPGNLGTIIRSADAFGASGIILSKGTVDLYNPKVVRASMGSLFHLPIALAEDDRETIGYLKEKKVKLLATALGAKQSIGGIFLKGPIAVMVGNEGAGLPDEITKLADAVVRIPMQGQAESLNVGIAAAIVLYEVLKQRTS